MCIATHQLPIPNVAFTLLLTIAEFSVLLAAQDKNSTRQISLQKYTYHQQVSQVLMTSFQN